MLFWWRKSALPKEKIENVATIFLTNRECPFRCLMCDLWKNTTNETVTQGSIPLQIEFALSQLPSTKHIKLYNSGNFFDSKAIPSQDHDAICQLLGEFDTVLVENHPKLTDKNVLKFRDKLGVNLQIALGLETIHPMILPLLNKQMKLEDFEKALSFLHNNDIPTRAFILLKPPFLDEDEGIYWAERSIDYAFDHGVECCAIIPTRSGNGAMNFLESEGYFQAPSINSLETVQGYGIALNKGRVLADVWDLEEFSTCDLCIETRKDRISDMNLNQEIIPAISCECQE